MKLKNLNILLSIIIIFVLAACKPSSPAPFSETGGNVQPSVTIDNTTKPLEAENSQSVTQDPDAEHGCIVAQSYKWCEDKQKCIKESEEKCEKATGYVKPKMSYYLIEEALAKKYGKSVDEFKLGIRKLTLAHFRGIVSGMDGVILAAKQNNDWVIVFDSVFGDKKTYTCTDVEKYNFPEDMISDCTK